MNVIGTDLVQKRATRRVADILVLVAAAACLRLWNLDGQSVWLDEYFSANYLDAPDVISFLREQRAENWEMVPLYYLVQYAWAQMTGGALVWVRLLSVLFGLGTVLLLYHIGARYAGRTAGMIAGMLCAFSPFHLFHSQEIRPYSMMIFLALLSCHTFLGWIDQPARKRFAAHLLANAMLPWTHLLAPLLFLPQGITLLLSRRCSWKQRLAWAGMHLVIMAPVLIWVATITPAPDPAVSPPPLGSPWRFLWDRHAEYRPDFFSKALLNEGEYLRWSIGFPPKHEDIELSSTVRLLIDARQPLELGLARLLLLTLTGTVLLSLPFRRKGQNASGFPDVAPRSPLFFIACFLVPLMTLFLLALFWKPHIFQSRYVAYCWPCAYLCCGYFVGRLSFPPLRWMCGLALCALMLGLGIAGALIPVRANYKAAAETLRQQDEIVGPVLLQDPIAARLLLFHLNDTPRELVAVPEQECFFALLETSLRERPFVWVLLVGEESRDSRERLPETIRRAGGSYTRHTWLGMQNLYLYQFYFPGGR